MVDVERQVQYWRSSAAEDWSVAEHLVERGKSRHGLFFAHLAVEKLLKALVCRSTGDLAPRLHNLVRLAELARLQVDETQLDTLADLSVFNLAGRYPDASPVTPTQEEAAGNLERAREVVAWLTKKL